MSPREVFYDRGKKLIPYYCPKCGTRYLKSEIPDVTQYICLFCRNVAQKEVQLRGEFL